MPNYNVKVTIDKDTRNFLKQHGYKLLVFKGVNAGVGAVSATWLTIEGHDLYDQSSININWTEKFNIGESATSLQSGAFITGSNPLGKSVDVGKRYTYLGDTWNTNPGTSLDPATFEIVNKPHMKNSFYVQQHPGSTMNSSPSNPYIVLQEILGNDGNASFEPLETVSMFLTTENVKVGTLMIKASSSGAIVSLSGAQGEAEIAYDQNDGWSGPSAVFSELTTKDPIYESMRMSASLAKVA